MQSKSVVVTQDSTIDDNSEPGFRLEELGGIRFRLLDWQKSFQSSTFGMRLDSESKMH